MGVKVPTDAEVLDKHYGVDLVEPLLYDSNYALAGEAIDILGTLGGPDAQKALRTFIARSQALTQEAQRVLAKP